VTKIEKAKYAKQYYAENKERLKAYTKQWQKEHPEKVSLAKKRHHEKYKHKHRAYCRQRETGFTPELFSFRLIEQENKCAICDAEFFGTPNADHDHVSKKPRGLLCRKCNLAIGLLQDSEVVIEAAILYIKKWKALSEEL
jgi:hypothetical protein